MIWLTADSHFGHTNILKHSRRPFSNTYEMEEVIVSNWNDLVQQNDKVYHLGDFCWKGWRQATAIAQKLNGDIYLLPGNHDKRGNLPRENITILPQYYELKIQEGKTSTLFVLCHYPIQSWNKKHYGSYHLHGHSHGNTSPQKGMEKRVDVGVDCWDFKPVLIEQIKALAEQRIKDE